MPRIFHRRFVMALVAGALAGLGQVPFSLTPAAFAALAWAAWMARNAGGIRPAAWIGFAAGTGYFAVTLHWIVEPFLVAPVRHGWMAPFALVFMSTGFALFWAAAFGLARWIGARGWRFAVGFGVSLAAAEMLRSYVLTGFPWALLGYVWTEGPAAQLGAWIGPFGLTLLTTGVAGIIAAVGSRSAGGAALLAAWLVPLAVGWSVAPEADGSEADRPVVRLVQPNAPQDEKWDPDRAWAFFERQLDYTAAPGSVDLVVWPETAVPFLLEPGHPALDRIAAVADGTPVAFGAQRYADGTARNSLVRIGPEGRVTEIYDKYHLVPFGEYVPLGGLTRYLGFQSFAGQDGYGYAPGPGPEILDFGRLGRVLPLICYEAIFPQDVAAAPERPDWLLQITNDAWFGTFAGPQQHLAQARMRAIEQGLPMIRVANTGISAVIDGAGRVLAALPLGQAGYLDHPLPAPLEPTLYSRTSDVPLAVALALLLALGVGFRRRE